MSVKLKVAIVGAGSRGINSFGVAFGEREDCDIVALCDPNAVRMEQAASTLVGEQKQYTDLNEMLNSEELDACVITSPDCFHEENAVAALNKGIHCLIDKPLATTVAGCKNIIKASENSGKIAMIGFNLRHGAVLKRLKQLIEDDALGRIFMIENREFYDGGRTYMSRWNRHYAISGGLWIHKGSHDFDVFNWLLDFPKPAKVSAIAGIDVLNPDNFPFEVKDGVEPGPKCSKCAYSDVCKDVYVLPEAMGWGEDAIAIDDYSKDVCMYLSDKDTHDNGFAIVEYENGVKAMHMECFITSITDRRYTVVGTKGQAEVSLTGRTILIRPRWSKETILHEIPFEEGGHGGADPGLVTAFVDAVSGKTQNRSTTEHGLLSTAIGQAAEISRRENRTVLMNELLG